MQYNSRPHIRLGTEMIVIAKSVKGPVQKGHHKWQTLRSFIFFHPKEYPITKQNETYYCLLLVI